MKLQATTIPTDVIECFLLPKKRCFTPKSSPNISSVPAVATETISVQVRELVEFARTSGDLGSSRDFVGSQRGLAGTRGHQRLQRGRGPEYRKEVRLSRAVNADEFVLKIQGRLDGVFTTAEAVVIEEIKTVSRGWNRDADPVHWAQAKVYGFIYGAENGLQELGIQLTYLDLDTGEEKQFRSTFALSELETWFNQVVGVYLDWLRAWRDWRELRDESIRKVAFPFPKYRPGQREVAVATYRALVHGQRLFAEAPTGIGKTISVVFPAVKALGERKVERLYYLTARTVGRIAAEQALSDLRQNGLRLRSVTLTAKEKLCVRDGQRCDPMDCPLARDYYARNRAAMRAALEKEEITRPVLEAVAQTHQVCPFELSLDVSSWVDVVICDYNYAFDPKVYLRRHFGDQPTRGVFLVDEAHNLVDRGREMFSAELRSNEIRRTRRAIKEALPRCARALSKVITAVRKLGGDSTVQAPAEEDPGEGNLELFAAQQPLRHSIGERTPSAENRTANETSSRVFRSLPEELLTAVDRASLEAEAWLARNEPAPFRQELLELYFQLHSFRRTAELYDERYVTLVSRGREGSARLYCLDPSFLLDQALSRGAAAVFFSATLTPLEYYRRLLGGAPDSPTLRLGSPFPPDNLAVLIQHRVRTHYKDRAITLEAVVEAIGAMLAGRAGNYLVYLPSYTYLKAVQERFQAAYPQVRLLTQRPGMTDPERDSFLREFAVGHPNTLVGFAVMGGVFGEGIDLVGDRLIGVAVVGVGLPQLCLERDLIGDYFQANTGSGFDYAYVFPGMNRVLQATGRVIRSETDRGVVLLIDTRFGEGRYRRLFPAWWRRRLAGSGQDILTAVKRFWG